MISLLADVNIEGHVARLVSHMQSDYWHDFWNYLDIRALLFQDVGLNRNDTDAVIWRLCQDQQLLLLTNNRNEDGPDSLEATIRLHNTSICVPVLTISDADLISSSKSYRERVVETLYDRLIRIESLRGTGRLYLP